MPKTWRFALFVALKEVQGSYEACITPTIPNQLSLSSRSLVLPANTSPANLSPGLTINQKQTDRCSKQDPSLAACPALHSPGDRRVWRTYLLCVLNIRLFFPLAQLSSAY